MVDRITRAMVAEAADYVRAHIGINPTIGLILGSGLNALAEDVSEPEVIPYQEIPHFPQATVAGHKGRLVAGQLGGAPVLLMQGRAHYYEGYSLAEITLPVRVMQVLGIKVLLVTNAAGGLRPDLRAGDLMAIVDHLNLMGLAGHNPLRGPNEETFGPRFPDMSHAYDAELLALLRAEAQERNIPLQEGVYAMVAGPSFETPAEVRFLRAIGADAVGMSTVPEVIVARHGGMRVLGVSLISNVAIASTATAQETTHEEVLRAGHKAGPLLGTLLAGVIRRLNTRQG
jgi:purine-nucleoside phosphorylase